MQSKSLVVGVSPHPPDRAAVVLPDFRRDAARRTVVQCGFAQHALPLVFGGIADTFVLAIKMDRQKPALLVGEAGRAVRARRANGQRGVRLDDDRARPEIDVRRPARRLLEFEAPAAIDVDVGVEILFRRVDLAHPGDQEVGLHRVRAAHQQGLRRQVHPVLAGGRRRRGLDAGHCRRRQRQQRRRDKDADRRCRTEPPAEKEGGHFLCFLACHANFRSPSQTPENKTDDRRPVNEEGVAPAFFSPRHRSATAPLSSPCPALRRLICRG